ncbi:hypothetical protein HI914_00418 [Erysiphe necator]|nr:hypothetical protein HI914_00418 [Erysiphe necator]
MSLSEQALSTVQERILHVREEINLHLALLESVDASVSNSQALEKELRGQLRELQRQYDNLKQNIDPTGQKTAAPSITSDHILDESAIFNLSREYYPIDSDASQEIKQSENGIGLEDYRESILTEFQHQNRKRQYSEYSEAAALSTRNVAKFQRLTLNSPVNRQKTKSLIVLDSTDESNDHSTELLVRQQKEIEERIQLERLDEQYARRLQSELESNYTDLNDQCHSYMRSPRAKKKITLNSSSSSCSNSKSNYESLKVRQPSIFDFSHQCNGESSNDANNTILIDLDDDSDVKSEITLDSLSSESEAEVEFVRSNTISTGAKINYQDGPKFMFESPKFAMDNVSNGFSHQNSLPSIYQKTPRSLYHFKANNISSKETISNHDGVPLPKSFINTEVKNSEINDECKELAKNIRLDTETRREETPQGLVHPLVGYPPLQF